MNEPLHLPSIRERAAEAQKAFQESAELLAFHTTNSWAASTALCRLLPALARDASALADEVERLRAAIREESVKCANAAERAYRDTMDDCNDARQAGLNAMEAVWDRTRSKK